MIKHEPDAKELDFLHQLEKHENKWVAVDSQAVIGYGDTPEEALMEARGKGFKNPVLIFIEPVRQRNIFLLGLWKRRSASLSN